jgi:hypothetical protein
MAGTAPLTHHDILALVAPFSRAGCVLDLPASDRAERLLRFKPVLHAATEALPALTETLTLQDSGGDWLLTRELRNASGSMAAELHAEGEDPAALLAAVQAVPPERQFPHVPGLPAPVALTQRCGPGGALVLREARAQVCGLALHLKLSGVRGYPATLVFQREATDSRRLPQDLLEVQGRSWTRLEPRRQGWEASMQVRGSEPERSADAEARLAQTLQHLQRTLSARPADAGRGAGGRRLCGARARGRAGIRAGCIGQPGAAAPDGAVLHAARDAAH